MHEEPLHLIPLEYRATLLGEINAGHTAEDRVEIEGDLCPACRFVYNRLLEQANGNWLDVVRQVRVKRLLLSEKDRVGIGTFQPKDEKNQDSTELTGDINYRKIAEYGSDSDPRAFNFDGELNIANRGLVEFIEILKLDVAFLYDLLTASQEHKIKPKKFAHTDIDEVISAIPTKPNIAACSATNTWALHDRDQDHILTWSVQRRSTIYQRDFNERRVVGKHRASRWRSRLYELIPRAWKSPTSGLTPAKTQTHDGVRAALPKTVCSN
jgi:serine protein kinase